MRTEAQKQAHAEAHGLGLRHQETWRGEHRGIPFMVKRHTSPGLGRDEAHNVWCYYLYLTKKKFKPEDWARIYTPPDVVDWGSGFVYRADILECCDFHSGITWCDARCQPCAPDDVVLEVGCDYNHLWDEELDYPYYLRSVMLDAKNSIDKLHENFEVLG